MLGASGTNVTTTPGGGPVPWTEDAVSSYVVSVTKDELIVTDFTDCVSDGEDIFSTANTTLRYHTQAQNLSFLLTAQRSVPS